MRPQNFSTQSPTMLSARTTTLAERYASDFATARPFRHVVMDEFLTDAFAARLLEHFPAFDSGNARTENGTVGNKSTVEKIRGLSPEYAALDDVLQSSEFLALVGRITGIPDLLYDPWYFGGGTHENRDTQDLDAHIDFNRHPIKHWHRRLNLIVYLNREWNDAWGGSLRLHSNPRSTDDSVVTITPLFNRAVVFETTENSWHSFPEIHLPPEKSSLTRKSVALYFYSDDRPPTELADTHSTIYIDRPLPERFAPAHVLSAEDIHDLRVLLIRRDQHLERLYGEVASLTKQLESAQKAARDREIGLRANAPSDRAPSPSIQSVPADDAPPSPTLLRALARSLPEPLKRPLRRWWHGTSG
jgi:2-oxoglutarate-Fe(II)-dependent oxygenase superfamily protein